MKKKILILTQPLHVNFGGTLQAYALQKVLEKMGYYVETINYRKKDHNDFYKLLSSLKNLIFNKKKFFHFYKDENKIIKMNHKSFIDKNIVYSCEINDLNDLKLYIDKSQVDTVIVGSDQVWRVDYSPRIETFFLDFLSNNSIKKIAYAASFGTNEWQFNKDETKKLKKLLDEFYYVSVRELEAVDLCKKYFQNDVDFVLDPTLLLTKTDYEQFINKNSESIDGGVFSYILDEDERKEEILEYISTMLKKEINYITIKNKKSIFIDNIEEYVVPSIEDWLSGIYNSSYVVTDSFHGMVFSIIFNKRFVVIPNTGRGIGRFYSLLKLLGLENRIINESTDINEILKSDIDYDKVNSIILAKRDNIKSTIELMLRN